MRSPSQRWRLSIVERTPPREVWFGSAWSRSRPRAPAVGDVERDQPAEARIAHLRHGRVPASRRASSRRRLGLPRASARSSVSRPRSSIAAASGAARGRVACARSYSRSRSSASRVTVAPISAS